MFKDIYLDDTTEQPPSPAPAVTIAFTIFYYGSGSEAASAEAEAGEWLGFMAEEGAEKIASVGGRNR